MIENDDSEYLSDEMVESGPYFTTIKFFNDQFGNLNLILKTDQSISKDDVAAIQKYYTVAATLSMAALLAAIKYQKGTHLLNLLNTFIKASVKK